MSSEKVLYIDIYHPTSEDEGLTFSNYDHLHKMDVKTSSDIGEIIVKLKQKIFKHYGDGLFIQAEEFKGFCYLNILVLFGSEYNFLVDYIESISEPYNGPLPETESIGDTVLSIDYIYNQEETVELQNELARFGVKSEVYFIKRKAFERGAGDYHENIILSLISGAVHAIGTKITEHLMKKFDIHQNPQVYDISSKKILSYISEETGISKQHLYITERRNMEKDKIEFNITNRYKIIEVRYDKISQKIDYRIKDKTQTMI